MIAMQYDPWTPAGFAGAVSAYEDWFLTEPERLYENLQEE